MKNEIITTPVVVKEKALPIPSPGKEALPLKIVLKSLKSCRWWCGGELWKGGLITFDNRRPTLGDKQDVKGSVCLATDYWISCVRWSKISNGQSTSILVKYNTLLGIQFYVEEGETGSWTLLGLRVKLSSCVSRPWYWDYMLITRAWRERHCRMWKSRRDKARLWRSLQSPLQRQRHQPNQETGLEVFSDGLNSLVREKQTSAARGQCGTPGTFFMFVFFFPTYKR